MRVSTPFLAGLTLLVAAFPARADEADQARTAKVLAALPAPSKEKGYEWTLDLYFQGQVAGSAQVKAAPKGEGDQAGWKSSGALEIPAEGLVIKSTEFSSRDLTTVEGEESKTDRSGSKEATWERTKTGYVVKSKTGDTETSKEVSAPAGAVKGLGTSLLLFCRMVPADAATYELTVLTPLPDAGEDHLETSKLVVTGAGKWEWEGKSVDAWVVRLEEGEKTGNLYFHPTTRDLLAIKFDTMPIVFLPKAPTPPPKPN